MPPADEAGCDAPPAFLPARPITQADLAALTERVRRRVIRWFRLTRLLDAAAAADILAWENSGFSVDASVRITLIDRDVPSYFRSLEHLLRYCARPPFALERLSVIRGPDGQIARIRYVLPRHKAANWVRPGRKSTRPGATGVVELSPFEFLDRLADLVPPPRKHRHRYHGVFAPNHRLRRAVTALAIGNIAKPHDAVAGGHAGDGHATGGCCDTQARPRSHDTSRIAWAKLMARVGEEFPLECPSVRRRHPAQRDGRQEPAHFEPEVRKRRRPGWLRPREVSPSHTSANRSSRRPSRRPGARPPTGASSCRSMTTATSFKRRPTSCPRSTSTASERCRTPGHDKAPRPPDSERLCADTRKTPLQRGKAGG